MASARLLLKSPHFDYTLKKRQPKQQASGITMGKHVNSAALTGRTGKLVLAA